MATEYKLSYTASEINSKLGKVDNTVCYTSQTLTDTQKSQARMNIGAASVDDIGGAISFTITLSTSGWSSNAQTISDSRFIANGYVYMVSPSSGSYLGYSEAQIRASDVTTDGQITFTCTTTPTTAITVNVVRMEATE